MAGRAVANINQTTARTSLPNLGSQGSATAVMMHFMAKERFLQLMRERALQGETFKVELPCEALQIEVFADLGDDLKLHVYNLCLLEKSRHFFTVNGKHIWPFGDEFTWA